MIFVCLGTRRFPFNRLLKQIDKSIENNEIKDKVFAQIGHSTYIPNNYDYTAFLSPEEYQKNVNAAQIIITHGGIGAIIKALKAGKQVIAIARREELGEHCDDHQLQIVDLFSELGYIRKVNKLEELGGVVESLVSNPVTKKFIGDGRVVEIIDDFIKS